MKSAGLFKNAISKSERHGFFLQELRKMAGIKSQDDSSIGFDYSCFMNERGNCHRNFSIAYYLKEKGCLNQDISVEEVCQIRF